MKRITFCICITALVAGATMACAADVNVVVSILPQAYFVERIGGSRVDVDVLIQPGQSPHTYEPTPRQMAHLGRARVYFTTGLSFEKRFIDKIAGIYPDLRIVDTREGVPLRYFGEREAAHEPPDAEKSIAQEEAAGAPDPHIWLDPERVKIQAATICRALSKISPANAAVFDANLRKFLGDLDAVDADIRTTLAPFKGATVYVFHPAFGYFCDAYGLNQVAVEIEGKEPTPRQLAALITKAKKDEVKIIFVQPQFSKKAAEAVATAIGGTVRPIDQLSRDYLNNLTNIAQAIKSALEKK